MKFIADTFNTDQPKDGAEKGTQEGGSGRCSICFAPLLPDGDCVSIACHLAQLNKSTETIKEELYCMAATTPEKDTSEREFYKSFNGAVWAKAFREIAIELGYSDMPEEWLIGWFANAIMRGYDEYSWSNQYNLDEKEEEIWQEGYQLGLQDGKHEAEANYDLLNSQIQQVSGHFNDCGSVYAENHEKGCTSCATLNGITQYNETQAQDGPFEDSQSFVETFKNKEEADAFMAEIVKLRQITSY